MSTLTRGTTNSNARGSSTSRRARRAWLLTNWAADARTVCGIPLTRCYRCGYLLASSDDLGRARWIGGSLPDQAGTWGTLLSTHGAGLGVRLLTVDRIIPGCRGGTYRRNNIRPACPGCNSETGGGLHA